MGVRTEQLQGQAVKKAVEANTDVVLQLLAEQRRTNQLLEWLGKELITASRSSSSAPQ